jgi:hypothetical protein
MERFTAAAVSLFWTATFAGISGFALLAADRGPPAALQAFGLPLGAADLATLADRPIFGGFSLGAAIVAALFATVIISSVLNGRQHLRQGAFIADMAFGGAFGLFGLAALAFAIRLSFLPLSACVVMLAAVAASFAAMRWAMRPEDVQAATPIEVRRRALDAAANANVIAFPITVRTVGEAR